MDRAQRIFKRVKLFCIMQRRCIHVVPHLSKPIACTTAAVNPDVNSGRRVITYRRVSVGSSVITMHHLVGTWTVGKAVRVGERVYGNSALSGQFCYKSQVFLKKNKVY